MRTFGGVTLTTLVAGRPALQLGILTFLPLLLSAMRGGLRLTGVTEALPNARAEIMGLASDYVLLPLFMPFLYLANFVNSSLTRKIRWRGLRYELISPQQTRVF